MMMRWLVVLLLWLVPGVVYGQGVLLVAARELQGAYAGTVLVAVPAPWGHIGVILNAPTPTKLAQLFPDHVPSQQVHRPVHVGGPAVTNAIFAMHRSPTGYSGDAVGIAPGVWMELAGDAVDRVIELHGDAARYYVGVVVWRAGELDAELQRGYFVEMLLDAELLFQEDTAGLYERLAPPPAPDRRQQQSRKMHEREYFAFGDN